MSPKSIKYNPYRYIFKFFTFWFIPLTWIPQVKKIYLPIARLVHDVFTNSIMATFLAIWYPLIFVLILPNAASAHYMLFGIGSMVPLIIGLNVMPVIIVELRNSSVLKRIGATNTKTSDLTLVLIFYFSIVAIYSAIFNLGIGFAIQKNDLALAQINWGQLIFVLFLGIIMGISFGMVVASLSKNQQIAMLIGLVVTLPGAFLSGQFLPPSLINNWGPVRYIAFIFPQKITTILSTVATNGGSIFQAQDVISTNYDAVEAINEITELPLEIKNQLLASLENNFVVTNQSEIIISWALYPVYITGFNLISIWKFRWSTK